MRLSDQQFRCNQNRGAGGSVPENHAQSDASQPVFARAVHQLVDGNWQGHAAGCFQEQSGGQLVEGQQKCREPGTANCRPALRQGDTAKLGPLPCPVERRGFEMFNWNGAEAEPHQKQRNRQRPDCLRQHGSVSGLVNAREGQIGIVEQVNQADRQQWRRNR